MIVCNVKTIVTSAQTNSVFRCYTSICIPNCNVKQQTNKKTTADVADARARCDRCAARRGGAGPALSNSGTSTGCRAAYTSITTIS